MKSLFRTLVFVLLFIGTLNSQTLQDSLITHYSLNGDASDQSSNQLDGTIYGSKITKDRFNTDSSAYAFNGINSYIEIGNNPKIKPDFPISISVWIKKVNDDQGWIFSNNINPEKFMGIFLGFGDNNIISLHYGNGLQVGTLSARRSIYAADPIALNQWYHVVGIIESEENMRLYLNGSEISTLFSGTATELVYDEGIAVLGKHHNWQNQNARYFKGAIDEFRFYNRNLEESEIQKLYNEGLSANPIITTISDVPNDQGGMVEIQFVKSIYDTSSLVLSKIMSPELYTIETKYGNDWSGIVSIVGYGKYLYSVLVPTSNDSTSESDGLISYRVIAGMNEGNFVSIEMHGYSVDNINPSTPKELIANIFSDKGIELLWDDIPDSDFCYYNVYRNSENYFDENSEPITQVIESAYLDNQVDSGSTYYYSVKSVDFSGNESRYSEIYSIIITSVHNDYADTPLSYALYSNYPNPFNPTTTITYSVPKESDVLIKVYDLLGNEVSTIVDDYKSSGNYELKYDGSSLSSGVYYYSMQAGNFSQTRKFILLK